MLRCFTCMMFNQLNRDTNGSCLGTDMPLLLMVYEVKAKTDAVSQYLTMLGTIVDRRMIAYR